MLDHIDLFCKLALKATKTVLVIFMHPRPRSQFVLVILFCLGQYSKQLQIELFFQARTTLPTEAKQHRAIVHMIDTYDLMLYLQVFRYT